ncbi:MAG: gliding motility-associated C-terminal domain-containing protein [Bacteroidota bacterium]|nr:gliding motility-associated C-terminal domain-containing protein [Bacteroidota bacterium]
MNRIVCLWICLISFLAQAQGQTVSLPLACGGSTVRYKVTGQKGSVYQWQVFVNNIAGGGTIVANYNDSIDVRWDNVAGVKTLKVTEHTAIGCTATPSAGSVLVSVPTLNFVKDTAICRGQSIELGPQGNYVFYTWNNGSTTRTITVTDAGKYVLHATDVNGCHATDSTNLVLKELPKVYLGKDTSLCGAELLTLDAGPEGIKYKWSYNDLTTQTIQVGAGRKYINVEVTGSNNCVNADTIKIKTCQDILNNTPNLFTPNGDGDNDTWNVAWMKDFDNVSVEIFDRWGRMVYQSKHGLPETGWDGNYKGKPLPMDSYFYVIDVHDGSEPKTGIITIVR